jgi:hypothetical protein
MLIIQLLVQKKILIKVNSFVRGLMIKSFKYFKAIYFKKVINVLQNNSTGKIYSGMV